MRGRRTRGPAEILKLYGSRFLDPGGSPACLLLSGQRRGRETEREEEKERRRAELGTGAWAEVESSTEEKRVSCFVVRKNYYYCLRNARGVRHTTQDTTRLDRSKSSPHEKCNSASKSRALFFHFHAQTDCCDNRNNDAKLCLLSQIVKWRKIILDIM